MTSENVYKVEVDESGMTTTVCINDIIGIPKEGHENETEELNKEDGNDKSLDDVCMNIDPTSSVYEVYDDNRQALNEDDCVMQTNNAQDFTYRLVGYGRMYRTNKPYNDHRKKCKSTPFNKSSLNRFIHRAVCLLDKPGIPIYTTETENISLLGVNLSEEVRKGQNFL